MILATLCYLQWDGKTLMLHRTKRAGDIHLGKWNGLGGKFESGESPEQCVIREVREESGLDIHTPHLCGLLVFAGFGGDDWYVFVFTACDFSGKMQENGEGYLEWIPNDQIENLPLWPSDHIFMPWIRDGKFFSARFVYQGDEMESYSVNFH